MSTFDDYAAQRRAERDASQIDLSEGATTIGLCGALGWLLIASAVGVTLMTAGAWWPAGVLFFFAGLVLVGGGEEEKRGVVELNEAINERPQDAPRVWFIGFIRGIIYFAICLVGLYFLALFLFAYGVTR